MRRPAALTGALVALLAAPIAVGAPHEAASQEPASASAEPPADVAPVGPCHWDPVFAPHFTLPSNVAVYHARFTCPGHAEGTYTLRAAPHRGAEPTAPSVEERGTARANGRWPRHTNLQLVYASNQYCAGLTPAPGAVVALTPDPDGELRLTVPVELAVTFEGTGPLAALNRTDRVTVRCDACEPRGVSGDVGLYEGRARVSQLGPATRLRVEVDKERFECARRLGRLDVRFFVGPDDASIAAAIRPALVLSGLDTALRRDPRRPDRLSLDMLAPYAALCRAAPKGGGRVAWEVGGRGPLADLGGGGRSFHTLVCR